MANKFTMKIFGGCFSTSDGIRQFSEETKVVDLAST